MDPHKNSAKERWVYFWLPKFAPIRNLDEIKFHVKQKFWRQQIETNWDLIDQVIKNVTGEFGLKIEELILEILAKHLNELDKI